jgi:hypothetical protein
LFDANGFGAKVLSTSIVKIDYRSKPQVSAQICLSKRLACKYNKLIYSSLKQGKYIMSENTNFQLDFDSKTIRFSNRLNNPAHPVRTIFFHRGLPCRTASTPSDDVARNRPPNSLLLPPCRQPGHDSATEAFHPEVGIS